MLLCCSPWLHIPKVMGIKKCWQKWAAFGGRYPCKHRSGAQRAALPLNASF